MNKHSGKSVSLDRHCEQMRFSVKRLGGDFQISMLINLSLSLSLSPERKTAFFRLGDINLYILVHWELIWQQAALVVACF